MEVEGHCRTCGHWFDAHWHNYPGMNTAEYFKASRKCPKCGGKASITTDESNDPPPGYEERETDDEEEEIDE